MNTKTMIEGKILPVLLKLSMPMMISMLVNSLYNIIDSWFVAMISADAMTALSLIFPMQNLINSIAVGFGVGINAVIAMHLGAGDYRQARKAGGNGLVLSVVHGIVLTVGMMAILPWFLSLYTSDALQIEYGLTYGRIVLAFSLVIMINLYFEKVFQATGKMLIPMTGMILGCIGNIILDPIMIFGLFGCPAMGIAGAALATGIGQVMTVAFYLICWFVKEAPVHMDRADFRLDGSVAARLYGIGVPATLNMALPSVLVAALNRMLAACSTFGILILGIYFKLQTFIYMPANGLIQGMRPMMSSSYGAGKTERVHGILKTAMCMNAILLAAGTLITLCFADQLIGLFARDPQVISQGAFALRCICVGFLPSAVSINVCGALEALGKGGASLWISTSRNILIILPVAWIFMQLWQATGIWSSFGVSELCCAILAWWIFTWEMKKIFSTSAAKSN